MAPRRADGRGALLLIRFGLLCLLLVGCGAAETSAPVSRPLPGPAPGLSLVPAPGGLDVAGSGGREIGFGRDRAGALAAVGKIEGTGPRAVSCPALGLDAVETAGGVVLVFTQTSFVGWKTGQAQAGRPC